MYGSLKRELGDFIASHKQGEVINTEGVKKFFEELDRKRQGVLSQYLSNN